MKKTLFLLALLMSVQAAFACSALAHCWISRAPFRGDKYLTDTQIRDLRIYNYALSDEEL